MCVTKQKKKTTKKMKEKEKKKEEKKKKIMMKMKTKKKKKKNSKTSWTVLVRKLNNIPIFDNNPCDYDIMDYNLAADYKINKCINIKSIEQKTRGEPPSTPKLDF